VGRGSRAVGEETGGFDDDVNAVIFPAILEGSFSASTLTFCPSIKYRRRQLQLCPCTARRCCPTLKDGHWFYYLSGRLRDDFQITLMILVDCAQCESSDAAEAIDTTFVVIVFFLLCSNVSN